MRLSMLLATCVVCACVGSGRAVSRPSTMVLENNEFWNVVVALHESMPDDPRSLVRLKVTII